MQVTAKEIMSAISPILNDPLAGRGALSLVDLIADRLEALEAANADPKPEPVKTRNPRGPNRPKPTPPAQRDVFSEGQ